MLAPPVELERVGASTAPALLATGPEESLELPLAGSGDHAAFCAPPLFVLPSLGAAALSVNRNKMLPSPRSPDD